MAKNWNLKEKSIWVPYNSCCCEFLRMWVVVSAALQVTLSRVKKLTVEYRMGNWLAAEIFLSQLAISIPCISTQQWLNKCVYYVYSQNTTMQLCSDYLYNVHIHSLHVRDIISIACWFFKWQACCCPECVEIQNVCQIPYVAVNMVVKELLCCAIFDVMCMTQTTTDEFLLDWKFQTNKCLLCLVLNRFESIQ